MREWKHWSDVQAGVRVWCDAMGWDRSPVRSASWRPLPQTNRSKSVVKARPSALRTGHRGGPHVSRPTPPPWWSTHRPRPRPRLARAADRSIPRLVVVEEKPNSGSPAYQATAPRSLISAAGGWIRPCSRPSRQQCRPAGSLSLRDSPQLNGYAAAQYNLPAYHGQHCSLSARVADNVELLSGAASDALQLSDVPVNENEKLT